MPEIEVDATAEEPGARLPVEVDDAVSAIARLDDASIVSAMQGAAVEDYVYTFKQGGRVVEGLTLAGINEAANQRGGIAVEMVGEVTETDTHFRAMVKATDTLTGSERIGASMQAKAENNRPDPYAFTKAVHKAQRNAVKQLLPVPVLKRVMAFYLGRGAPATPEREENHELPKGDSNQRSCFAAAKALQSELQRAGISDTDFWDYVKKRYEVESRAEMTAEQWAELGAELQAAKRDATAFGELTMEVKPVGDPNDIPF